MPDNTNGSLGPHDSEEELSQDEIDQFIRRFEELDRDCQELQSINDHLLDTWLRELAGQHFEILLQSQDNTLRFFSDPNPKLRRAAIHLAVEHWRLTDLIVASCERMATTDPDFGVRESATGALGTCYASTKDARVGALLASMIYDELLPARLRMRAYLSLVRLHGYSEYAGNSIISKLTVADIDWEFVQNYRRTPS